MRGARGRAYAIDGEIWYSVVSSRMNQLHLFTCAQVEWQRGDDDDGVGVGMVKMWRGDVCRGGGVRWKWWVTVMMVAVAAMVGTKGGVAARDGEWCGRSCRSGDGEYFWGFAEKAHRKIFSAAAAVVVGGGRCWPANPNQFLIIQSRDHERNLDSQFTPRPEMNREESPLDTMVDQRTMEKLLRTPTEGYGKAIVVPPILAEHFELKHSLVNMMTSDKFFGFEEDNHHDHIRWFNKITSTIKYNALNPADQDSLNSAAGGNLLERRTQDVLTIIENKSKDNIQGYVSAAAVNYNQGSGPLASNTIANPKGKLKSITTRKMLKALISNKENFLELANTPLNENCSVVILKKLPEKLGDPRKFLILCGFNELKCKDLADLEVINPLSGNTTSSSPDHSLEEFADELALITFPPGNDDLLFDIKSDLREIEYLLNHDPTKEMDSILEDFF
nr:reverse transcriptase domain-containing protein [Tanacetum cinerariifolium]